MQENGPERVDFKKKLYRQIDELLPADVIIASSSSGLTMSEIQSDCRLHPERCVIGHPFNPPHLVPLVELVGGAKTSEATIERAAEFYTRLGKQAVRLRKEVPGHVANRLQAALAREVYYLVAEDVISALSSLTDLIVISRLSTTAFRRRPYEPRSVSETLAVRYVLSGTLYTSGSRLRIAADLSDAATGQGVWAERFESSIRFSISYRTTSIPSRKRRLLHKPRATCH